MEYSYYPLSIPGDDNDDDIYPMVCTQFKYHTGWRLRTHSHTLYLSSSPPEERKKQKKNGKLPKVPFPSPSPPLFSNHLTSYSPPPAQKLSPSPHPVIFATFRGVFLSSAAVQRNSQGDQSGTYYPLPSPSSCFSPLFPTVTSPLLPEVSFSISDFFFFTFYFLFLFF